MFDPARAIRRLDAMIERQLEAIYAHPAMAFVHAWRAVSFVCDRVGPGQGVVVSLVPCTKDELHRDRDEHDPSTGALAGWLEGWRDEAQDAPFAVLVPLDDLGPTLLGRVADCAAWFQAVVVAHDRDAAPYAALRAAPRARHVLLCVQRAAAAPGQPWLGTHLWLAALLAETFGACRHIAADEPPPHPGVLEHPLGAAEAEALRDEGAIVWAQVGGDLDVHEVRTLAGSWLGDTALPARLIHYHQAILLHRRPGASLQECHRELYRWTDQFTAHAGPEPYAEAIRSRRPLRERSLRLHEEDGWWVEELDTTWHRRPRRRLSVRAALLPVDTPST